MRKRIKLESRSVRLLARKYDIRGNIGHRNIATLIAQKKGDPIPATKNEAHLYLVEQLHLPQPQAVSRARLVRHEKRPVIPFEQTDDFLRTYEWRRIRMVVLKRDKAICACCNATRESGLRMHVDHIKPRKLFPHLALDVNNLQILCEVCNHGKGNWDMTDWRRAHDSEITEEQMQHIKSISE